MDKPDQRWLILPVEVKHREFLSRIVVAALAAKRGYRVLLGKDTVVRRLAPVLPRGVIFDKSLGTARHAKPQRLHRLGHKIVVLDEESTGFYGSPEQFLSVRLARETLAVTQRWYCISDTLREHATRLYPEFADHFLTTGLVRTDVWRKPFRGFYKPQCDAIAAKHGPYILFCSNFGGILHARGEAFVQKQIRGQKSAYAKVQQRSEKIFSQGRKNLEAFLEVLPQITRWFPDHKLVIRPHPSENVSFWKDKFAESDRIVVENDSVATPWILASAMLIHHGCTTGIEAEILAKPHVMYAPFPDSHHDTEVMRSFAPIAKTAKALRKIMIAGFDKPGGSNGTIAAKASFFASLSGKMASEKILDDIDDLAFPSTNLPKWLPLMRFTPRLLAASLKPRSARELAYAKQKWPGTDTAEISTHLAIAANALGIEKPFTVEEVFPELFEISLGKDA